MILNSPLLSARSLLLSNTHWHWVPWHVAHSPSVLDVCSRQYGVAKLTIAARLVTTSIIRPEIAAQLFILECTITTATESKETFSSKFASKSTHWKSDSSFSSPLRNFFPLLRFFKISYNSANVSELCTLDQPLSIVANRFPGDESD